MEPEISAEISNLSIQPHSSQSSKIFLELQKASSSELKLMGGKAATLAHLLAKGFPVPPGAVMLAEPKTPVDFSELMVWWKGHGSFPVAARSSASGEDSADFSYAGQFVTVLNISSEEGLKAALKTCFQSVRLSASQAYANHFERAEIPMHVLVQRMIQPEFSGVFFSQDPRGESDSWLVEVVEGLGEQLVSGQVTPFRFSPNGHTRLPQRWQASFLEEIVKWGQAIQKELGYLVDMEWAIDKESRFWILQSRPITAKGALSEQRKVLNEEWQRLLDECNPESVWDAHTFAEWTGVPTEFGFDVWSRAFKKDYAFDLALREIGYEGVSSTSFLERVFGRAYLNLKVMEPIYFGQSPYRLISHPRPHLQFSWNRLNLKNILHAPKGIWEMAEVAWTIQTARKEISQKALAKIQQQGFFKLDAENLYGQVQSWSTGRHSEQLRELVEIFSKEGLQSTFLVTLLIESTTQGLMAILAKDFGEEQASQYISKLTGAGLQTVASEMLQQLSGVNGDEEGWQKFVKKYGHRGVGELELSHPRWIETKIPMAKKTKGAIKNSTSVSETLTGVLTEVQKGLSSLRRAVFNQEWQELQRLLQVREQIKMEIMKPYAQIRWLLLKMAAPLGLGADIFWLTLDEVLALEGSKNIDQQRSLIEERKHRAQVFKAIDLPMIFSLQDLKQLLADEGHEAESQKAVANPVLNGVSLSPGVAAGVVHIVNDPEMEDVDSWPENVIVVAEATDPGWTPLFERAQAVVVARGGVLSHCAIVAREMGLPAVGEIRAATQVLKEGEYVWVDGNHGHIRRAH